MISIIESKINVTNMTNPLLLDKFKNILNDFLFDFLFICERGQIEEKKNKYKNKCKIDVFSNDLNMCSWLRNFITQWWRVDICPLVSSIRQTWLLYFCAKIRLVFLWIDFIFALRKKSYIFVFVCFILSILYVLIR